MTQEKSGITVVARPTLRGAKDRFDTLIIVLNVGFERGDRSDRGLAPGIR